MISQGTPSTGGIPQCWGNGKFSSWGNPLALGKCIFFKQLYLHDNLSNQPIITHGPGEYIYLDVWKFFFLINLRLPEKLRKN